MQQMWISLWVSQRAVNQDQKSKNASDASRCKANDLDILCLSDGKFLANIDMRPEKFVLSKHVYKH